MNKKLVYGIIAAVVLLLGGTVLALRMPLGGSFFLDLNPSVQIDTNLRGDVVKVTGLNADGVNLLQGYNIKDNDLDDVIEDIVDRMILGGYLKPENRNYVMVSSDKKGMDDIDDIKTMVNSKLVLRNIDGKAISLNSNEKIEFEDDKNLSPAKQTLFDRVNKLDKNLTLKDVENMSVKDLLALLAANNIDADDFFDDLNEDDVRYFKDQNDDDDDDRYDDDRDDLDDRDDDDDSDDSDDLDDQYDDDRDDVYDDRNDDDDDDDDHDDYDDNDDDDDDHDDYDDDNDDDDDDDDNDND